MHDAYLTAAILSVICFMFCLFVKTRKERNMRLEKKMD